MLKITEHKGVKFFYREGFSDLKTFEEVFVKDVYQKTFFKIAKGEKWMDCGGNVGAFALKAISCGASVEIFEPDPFNCKMIEKNLALNGFDAKIFNAALVHDETKSTTLFIGNNNQVWRNSIVKKMRSGKGLKVNCVNFDEVAVGFDGCKMDIEGAEMPILEHCQANFKKLVYEWSFDIDSSLPRLWAVIDKQRRHYKNMKYNSAISYEKKEHLNWQNNWFPRCVNVHAWN